MGRLRRYLIEGLIVIAPVGVTLAVLLWLFRWVDGLLGRFLYPSLGYEVPGLGLIALLVLLLVVGWVAERAIGARLVTAGRGVLERLPITRRLYNASSRIVSALLSGEKRAYGDAVLIEWPAPGRWVVGFMTGAAPASAANHLDDPVTVYVPTAPNPVSGYLVLLPRAEAHPVGMDFDQSLTFVLSAGSVVPTAPESAGPRTGGAPRPPESAGRRAPGPRRPPADGGGEPAP